MERLGTKLETIQLHQHTVVARKMENSHSTTGTSAQQIPPTQADSTTSLAQRRAFMRLTLEERRRILAQQAEEMLAHYQEDSQ